MRNKQTRKNNWRKTKNIRLNYLQVKKNIIIIIMLLLPIYTCLHMKTLFQYSYCLHQLKA